ncbi:MAG TPA: hypothetical protein VNL14_16420 [Candidatus Acidoferrales bacterium]|nr:hypothetical protein [Candidatus Acidoferrales bacterium]
MKQATFRRGMMELAAAFRVEMAKGDGTDPTLMVYWRKLKVIPDSCFQAGIDRALLRWERPGFLPPIGLLAQWATEDLHGIVKANGRRELRTEDIIQELERRRGRVAAQERNAIGPPEPATQEPDQNQKLLEEENRQLKTVIEIQRARIEQLEKPKDLEERRAKLREQAARLIQKEQRV